MRSCPERPAPGNRTSEPGAASRCANQVAQTFLFVRNGSASVLRHRQKCLCHQSNTPPWAEAHGYMLTPPSRLNFRQIPLRTPRSDCIAPQRESPPRYLPRPRYRTAHPNWAIIRPGAGPLSRATSWCHSGPTARRPTDWTIHQPRQCSSGCDGRGVCCGTSLFGTGLSSG